MATNYANNKLTTAIKSNLLIVDAISPRAEVSKLAGELAQVYLTEFNTAGSGSETVENLFASAFKAKGEVLIKQTKVTGEGAALRNAAFFSRCD
jgi:hypothetical protein